MSMFATSAVRNVRRRTSGWLRVALRALAARVAAEAARHRAIRTRRGELDRLLMAEEHVFRDIGLTRLDVVHERLATRTWF